MTSAVAPVSVSRTPVAAPLALGSRSSSLARRRTQTAARRARRAVYACSGSLPVREGGKSTQRVSSAQQFTRSVKYHRRGVVVGQRVIERDIRISTRPNWHAGAGPPARHETDLQTALLHELGHFAGNAWHADLCTNTPMVEALAAGEWWHTRSDYFFRGCGFARPAAASSSASRLRFVHRHIVHSVHLDGPAGGRRASGTP